MMERRVPGHSASMAIAGTLDGPIASAVRERADAAPARRIAFDAVYADYFDFVWRSLRRLGVSEGAVDDAVQEVFLVVHRRLAAFEGRSSIKTWIFGIALRVAKDCRRASRRKGPHEPLDDSLPDPAVRPDDALANAEVVTFVERFLARLDADKRAVFILAELEEMTAPEIADALGVRLNTVYSRIRAVRGAFEEEVARYRRREKR
jgi:RNA polymerase sigma-70 factor (ECF subfamily)